MKVDNGAFEYHESSGTVWRVQLQWRIEGKDKT